MIAKAMGQLLKARREALSLPQYKAAKAIGFAPQFLGRIEKGEVNLPYKKIRVAVRVLKIPRSQLEEALMKDHKDFIQSIVYKR